MNNLAFIVKIRIHVCLLRDTWSLREVKGDNPLCGVGRYASPDSLWFLRISNLKQGIIFYLVGFVSLVWSLDRVTQVVMDGLAYLILSIFRERNPEHARKNSKVLRVLRWEGDFFTIPTVFA